MASHRGFWPRLKAAKKCNPKGEGWLVRASECSCVCVDVKQTWWTGSKARS